jgi:hypothetical protein
VNALIVPELLEAAAVADLFHLSTRDLFGMVRRKTFPAPTVRINQKRAYWSKSAIQSLFAEGQATAESVA